MVLGSPPSSPRATASVAGLEQLPLEVIGIITANLAIKDIHNMSLTCHRLQWALMHCDHIAKTTLQASRRSDTIHAPSSLEARDACSGKTPGSHTRGLRRFMKRRLALATAAPFCVAQVAMVDAYVYCNGMLCYTTHEAGTRAPDFLRLLNLHQSSSTETVIHLRRFLCDAVNLEPADYTFEPIHYATGLVSCVFKPLGIRNTVDRILLVLRPSTNELVMRKALRRPLDYDYFIRNTHDQIWLGEWESVTDGRGHLILRCFCTACGEWTTWFVRTPDFVGDELGKTLCVEIIDDYMYVVSNSTTSNASQARDEDWVSHYYALRFPLTAPDQLEVAPKERLWRRHHQEGPIHDTAISLEHDTASGKLTIVEVRRENPGAVWPPVTTCYRTDLNFSPTVSADSPKYQKEAVEELREPSSVHRFDEACQDDPFKPYYVRSYQKDSEGFLDVFPGSNIVLCGDPGPNNHPWLRLRSASKSNEVAFWPPEPIPDSGIERLYHILRPQHYPGRFQIQGTIDERSVVYAVGERKPAMLRPIILMSFDPALKLCAPCWPGGGFRPFSNVTFGPPPTNNNPEDVKLRDRSGVAQAGLRPTPEPGFGYPWGRDEPLSEISGFNFAM